MEEGGDIGKAEIRPEAENTTTQRSSVSAKQEANFFDDAGRAYALEQGKQAMGWLGRFWGAGGASTNIAGLVILVALAIYVGSLFSSADDAANVRSGMLALATGALGYIFGSPKKGD